MVIRIDKLISQELIDQIIWVVINLDGSVSHNKYIICNIDNSSARLVGMARILNALRSYGINELNRTKLNKKEWEKEQLKLKMLGVI